MEEPKEKTELKQKNQKEKGITLIALVITIIVLLILAGVTISTLTGGNGILTKASDASKETEIASVKEQAQLDISNWITEELENGRDGTISGWENIKNILDIANPDAKDRYYINITEEGIETPNGYLVPMEEIYKTGSGGGKTPIFDENTLEIGEAINTDKYGYIVPEYTIQTSEMSSNVWRLFYQDSKYTYLITDEVIGNYKPSDYYDYYANGSMVSTIGQRLSPKLLDKGTFFTEDNTNLNIRMTAWLTDTSETSMWNEYKNNDAVFAIGSSTVELYVASFNATAIANSANSITVEAETYGYNYKTVANQLKTSYNYGIYNKSKSSSYWFASPSNFTSNYQLIMYGLNGYFYMNNVSSSTSPRVRPIICIPTSVFNQKYTLSNPEDNS